MAPHAPFVEDGIADKNPPYVIQLQYLYPVNDAITFTPGAFVVLNPQGNSDNSAIWVGLLRTVFQF
jgi:carbohydrate-selective porin OprB